MPASQKWSQPKIILIVITAAIIFFGGLFWLAKASSAPPTVKIGLVAPFEGLYRATGYEVLFAVKVALQERNQGDGLNGYRVELVALNDFNDPDEARRQARALVVDPDIVGVVGHLTSASTLAALPIYRQADLALVIPWSVNKAAFNANQRGVVSVAATTGEANAQLESVSQKMGIAQLKNIDVSTPELNSGALQFTTDAVTAGNIILNLNQEKALFGQVEVGNKQLVQVAGPAANGLIFVSPGPAADDLSGQDSFVEAYQRLAGFPPGPRAILAYDATNILLDSIEQAMIENRQKWAVYGSSRAEISRILTTVNRNGLTGDISFDAHGRRYNAPIWFYKISKARYPGTLIVP